MAKKKSTLFDFGALPNLGKAVQDSINASRFDFSKIKVGPLPNLDFKSYGPATPIANPELYKNIKPLSEQFSEALEPLQIELSRVTGELIHANQQTALANEKAERAERKADRSNTISILMGVAAIVIPIVFSIWQSAESQREQSKLKTLQSSVYSLSLTVRSLQADLSQARKSLISAKPRSGTIVLSKANHPLSKH